MSPWKRGARLAVIGIPLALIFYGIYSLAPPWAYIVLGVILLMDLHIKGGPTA